MREVLQSGIAVMVCAQCAVATPTPGVSFSLLGDLPGGNFYSSATAISGDGTTVVGQSISTNGFEAFVWRAETGMVGIGDLPTGEFSSLASGVSHDGSVVVGIGRVLEGPFSAGRAFRWTAGSGMVDLGTVSGTQGSFSNAHAVSAGGQYIAGTSATPSGFDMFRWDEANGMMSLGGFEGRGVTDDGSVVVGFEAIGGGAFEAQRWTLETGPVGLGFLSGAAGDSRGNAVSPDGRFIIGSSSSPAAGAGSREAFRWTESGGMVGLGSTDPESGSFFTEALAINMDGSVIVGFEQVVGDDEFFATIWTQGVGMQRLDSVLAGMGAELFGFTLLQATGISADGLTIVGVAEDREGFRQAFIATIPAPPAAGVLAPLAVVAARRRRR
ncbi:MAG: PEP-CTERM sorting domain-containing protein [Phycisphaeraceae bacterium]|nr:hypothetical protein [Phycisphaerales bacterium]MCB9842400.1 PEP-CTERM sorting domain-containing protein [Phycisphaeraceae bacterium]